MLNNMTNPHQNLFSIKLTYLQIYNIYLKTFTYNGIEFQPSIMKKELRKSYFAKMFQSYIQADISINRIVLLQKNVP